MPDAIVVQGLGKHFARYHARPAQDFQRSGDARLALAEACGALLGPARGELHSCCWPDGRSCRGQRCGEISPAAAHWWRGAS